jgi:hypothetical protein
MWVELLGDVGNVDRVAGGQHAGGSSSGKPRRRRASR